MRVPGVECQLFKLSSARSADSPQGPTPQPRGRRISAAVPRATCACWVSDANVVVGIRVKSCIRAYGMPAQGTARRILRRILAEIDKIFDGGEDLG